MTKVWSSADGLALAGGSLVPVREDDTVFGEGTGAMEEFGKFLLAFECLVQFPRVSFGGVLHDDVSVFGVLWAVVEHMGR